MDREITLSGLILIILSTLITKGYLVSSLISGKQGSSLQLPALILSDLLLLAVISLLVIATQQYLSKSPKFVLRVSHLLFVIAFTILVITLNSSSIAYYQRTTAIIDWGVVLDFFEDISSSAKLAVSNLRIATFWLSAHFLVWIGLFFGVRYFSKSRTESISYLALGKSDPSVSKAPMLLIFGITLVLSIYYIWAIRNTPKFDDWNRLKSPIVVSFISSASHKLKSLRFNAMVKDGQEYSHCHTIRATFEAAAEGKLDCLGAPKVPNLDFLKRDGINGINNLVFLYLESARSDILPLNKESPWVKENINQTILRDHPISPFLSSLADNSLYFENIRTISTFTLKSLRGTLCSSLPLPVNFYREWNKAGYLPCLPQILKGYGWDTIYLSPSTSHWDNQCESFLRIGFDRVVGSEELESQESMRSYYKEFQSVNYFGYDDIPMIKPMIDWIKERKSLGRPAFVTMQTNVNHDPYNCPKNWTKYPYTDSDQTVNNYLNTARYTDHFVKTLVENFERENLSNETLLVILGDHGMALGEHGRVGTNENAAEPLLKVPLFFYSTNKEWLKSNPPKKVTEQRSSLDILPTILDMLSETSKSRLTNNFMDYFEGISLKVKPNYNPVMMSIINPGAYGTVYYQDGRKIVFNELKEEYYFYNLEKDPEEIGILDEELELKDRKWIDKLKKLNDIVQNKIHHLWTMNEEDVIEEGSKE